VFLDALKEYGNQSTSPAPLANQRGIYPMKSLVRNRRQAGESVFAESRQAKFLMRNKLDGQTVELDGQWQNFWFPRFAPESAQMKAKWMCSGTWITSSDEPYAHRR